MSDKRGSGYLTCEYGRPQQPRLQDAVRHSIPACDHSIVGTCRPAELLVPFAADEVLVWELNNSSADCDESKEWRHQMILGPWPGEARVRSKSRAAQFDMDTSYQIRHCAAQT